MLCPDGKAYRSRLDVLLCQFLFIQLRMGGSLSLIHILVIFTVMGFACETSGTEQIAEFTASLNARFHITPWLLIVPVVTGILIARKVPSIITLFLSTLLAATFAIIFQPELLHEISGNNDLFEGTMMSLYGSTNPVSYTHLTADYRCAERRMDD